MRTGTRIAGIATAAAAMLAIASPAFADSAENDGINLVNDNNISAAAVQACGNNVAVIGAVIPLVSPQANKCLNAPIVDHPMADHVQAPKPPQNGDNSGECSRAGLSPEAKCLSALTQP